MQQFTFIACFPCPCIPCTLNFHLDFFFFFFAFSRATPVAYGGSKARGLIGAVAAGLRQSHSNTGSCGVGSKTWFGSRVAVAVV